ncbi:MAG: ATP-binding protein [Bacteroidales bacterium]|nr:ATP-binding protein [Bacteroidales bacterium]
MQKLPIGIQTFKGLREDDYLYVDKTVVIHQLVTEAKVYFLSRPRRFGKSLLCSTLKAYFEGKKELFKGLAIEKLETEWTEYPVLYFDFNGQVYGEGEGLRTMLNEHLKGWESTYGISSTIDFDSLPIERQNTTLASRFFNVVVKAHEQTGKRVVVIVDEYDKPLLESPESQEIQEQSRALLKGFFGNLKKLDEHLKFVFFTGVTKFSKVSIFSDLNQLRDISLNEKYETICGISKDELLSNFTEHISALAEYNKVTYDECVALLKRYYDGYHFSERMTDMFNPFSILNAFGDGKFGFYWFSTGTPTFLVKRLASVKNDFDFKKLSDGVSISIGEITDYRPDNTNIIPLLYQSGYLTIKEFDLATQIYTLAYPNEEVKYGMLNSLAPEVTSRGDTTISLVDMRKALNSKNVDDMMLILKSVYASLPYIKPIYREDMDEEDRQDVLNKYIERDFQNVIYIFFLLMGQPTYSEVQNNLGRADCIVETDKYVYLFEFKVESSADEALQQIKAHEYASRYAADKREVICVGVNFGRRKRNITEWKVG